MPGKVFDPPPEDYALGSSVFTNSPGGYGAYSIQALSKTGYLQKSWGNSPNYWAAKRAKGNLYLAKGSKNGNLPSQYFHLTHDTFDAPKGSFTWHDGLSGFPDYYANSGVITQQYVQYQCGNYPRDPGFPLGRLSDAVDAKLLAKVKSQDVNLAQAFGERHQTVRLFSDNITKIAKTMLALRHGDFVGVSHALGLSKAKWVRPVERRYRAGFKKIRVRGPFTSETTKLAAQTLLELRYGWQPLLSDIHGSLDAIQKANSAIRRTYVNASSSDEDSWQETDVMGPGYGILLTRLYNTFATLKKSLAFRIISGNTKTLAEVGILNPAALAWELLPWSFVVDWALPIGPWISNFDATAGCEFLWGTMSYRTRSRVRYELKGSPGFGPPGPSYWVVNGFASGGRVSEWVHREALTAFPSNPLPHLKNPLSMTHAQNAMALLRTAFRR